MAKKKRVKSSGSLPKDDKQVRVKTQSQEEYETIVWRFSIVDLDGDWGWRTVAGPIWWNNILPKLQRFESMTWEAIMEASGGRKRGNNSHFVEVKNLTKQAKNRLKEIKQEDVSQLFSLRLSSKERIYGIRDRRALKLIWFDPTTETTTKPYTPSERSETGSC